MWVALLLSMWRWRLEPRERLRHALHLRARTPWRYAAVVQIRFAHTIPAR